MSSGGRPSSRRGSSSSDPPGSAAKSRQIRKSEYHPHLFDLVYASGKAEDNYLKIDIPNTYREAASVDSAQLLGHGASFTASVRTLPPGPTHIRRKTKMPWGLVEAVEPAPPRPQCIVYKTARVAFDEAGDALPTSKSALQSVMTEYHALIYPPLFKHPNIIAFFGLAWGTNEFNPQHRLPALIVEYAEHGTLADVLSRQSLQDSLAQALCYDTASALQAIHDAGLVHGDVKAENVLICQGQHRYIAKLADFGYSVVREAEQEAEAWIGGTRPWKAPETAGPIPVEDLQYTDIFSLGLLFWVVGLQGRNPFAIILDNPSETEIEAIKQSDKLLELSRTEFWYAKFFQEIITSPDLLRPLAKQLSESSHPLVKSLTTASSDALSSIMQFMTRHKEHAIGLIPQVSQAYIKHHALLSRLDGIFANSLNFEAHSRNLARIIDILRPGVAVAEPHISRREATKTQPQAPPASPDVVREILQQSATGPRTQSGSTSNEASAASNNTAPQTKVDKRGEEVSWIRRGYKHSWYAWQAMLLLSPRIQQLVFRSLVRLTDYPSRFLLAAAYINGYGCQQDHKPGLDLIRLCADAGHQPARAYLYRLHRACGVDAVEGYSLTQYLDPTARSGCRAAFQDLTNAGMHQEASSTDHWLTRRLGGVGVTWFADDNMLHGLNFGHWLDLDFFKSTASKVDDINSYRINKRGDTLLHMMASCGEHKARIFLVNELKADINCRNYAGDTPLISVCRAGNGGSAIVFLQNYKADASLASDNGETALHWLISFPDGTIDPLAKDLVAQGAVVDAATTERISHSFFPGTIDCDFQLPGTPLQWAVHHNRPVIVKKLLQLGADPNIHIPGAIQSPLERAAYFHHAECLKIMIDHAEETRKGGHGDNSQDLRFAVLYGPLLASAVHSADRFSMILRNGHEYLNRLHATLDLIREKTKLVNMGRKFGGNDQDPFYFAVAEGHDEVVQYMIKHNWLISDLNTPAGPEGRTAVLEAVRWSRLSLAKNLVQNGADIHALAKNPFTPGVRNWSALHVFAHEGCTDDQAMLPYLIGLGIPVDPGLNKGVAALHDLSLTDVPNSQPCESALSCALRNNAFELCDELIRLGANPHALSTSAGLFTAAHPTSILGHIIISNARLSYDRIKYLCRILQARHDAFIVEPFRKITALHRASMGCSGIKTVDGLDVRRREFDWDTNRSIMRQLVTYYKTPEELNARCAISGRAALHLAVSCMNVGAVQILLEAGADRNMEDDEQLSPLELIGEATVDNDEEAIAVAAIMEMLSDE